ncbi:MAG: esterase family protein [Kordiimonadaceae bacterium]|nr:esterase family protein [Kordiimonadaceae bacterium]
MRVIIFLFGLLASSIIGPVFAKDAAGKGTLSENIRIESKHLGYALQYRVYTPAGYTNSSKLPTIYMTDGQGYISRGRMPYVLDTQIKKGAIKPVIDIFVDPRDPDNLRKNRRNEQFFCNNAYAEFFRTELIPAVSMAYKVSTNRDDRVILGLSFGGLNAACFGMNANDVFKGIAIQSPALHPVPNLHKAYKENTKRPIKIFFSLGSIDDNTAAGRRFKRTLKNKNYELFYKEVAHGHNWTNWQPLLDDVLIYFFGK